MPVDSEGTFRTLFQHLRDGFAYCRMLFADGRPQDFIYLTVNDAFETLTGLRAVTGKQVSQVIPGIRHSDPHLFETLARVATTGSSERLEMHLNALDMWLDLSLYSPTKDHFIAVFDVITERVKAEHALRAANTLLERTEAIAHVGSWRLDVSSGSVSWSAEMYRIFGLDPSEPALTATDEEQA